MELWLSNVKLVALLVAFPAIGITVFVEMLQVIFWLSEWAPFASCTNRNSFTCNSNKYNFATLVWERDIFIAKSEQSHSWCLQSGCMHGIKRNLTWRHDGSIQIEQRASYPGMTQTRMYPPSANTGPVSTPHTYLSIGLTASITGDTSSEDQTTTRWEPSRRITSMYLSLAIMFMKYKLSTRKW